MSRSLKRQPSVTAAKKMKPLCDLVMGAGETQKEAWQVFRELLEETHATYQEGKLARYSKPGRPAKGKVQLHAEVDPDIKKALSAMAKDIGISQGETVEYLLKYYQTNRVDGQ